MEIRLGRTKIALEFGFPALLAVILLCSDRTLLLETAAVCILHECGHGAAMLLSRAGLGEIRFTAAGLQLRAGSSILPVWVQELIYLAGPAANLLCAALLWHIRVEFAALHLCMGLFNLLPYGCLDGGAALRQLFPDGSRQQKYLCTALSAALAVVMVRFAVRNPLLYLMLLYLTVREWL